MQQSHQRPALTLRFLFRSAVEANYLTGNFGGSDSPPQARLS